MMALSRDAVVGYEEAHEPMMEKISVAERVVGTSEVEGWKRSGYVASIL